MSAALRTPCPDEPDRERMGAAAFVLSLRARGIMATDVLRAMETVRREHFAPRRFADLARSDVALPLACGQTMTAPAVVAQMLVALDVRPGHRVLEVGTGSGYVAALLTRLGAEVHAVERHPVLAEGALGRLAAAGFSGAIDLVCGDGLGGGPSDLRYDRILLNGAIAAIGPALTSRLTAQGRLVGASSSGGFTRLVTILRDPAGELVREIGQLLRIARLTPDSVHGSRHPATES